MIPARPSRRRPALAASARAALACAALLVLAGAAVRADAERAAADRLAATSPGRDRDARLVAWARHAALDDVLWVLRRPPAQLGPAEGELVDAALARCGNARLELRRKLEARRLLLDPRAAQRERRDAVELEALRPRASVWRVAVLLPDRGDYAGYSASLRAGIDAGLASAPHAAVPAPEAEFHGTGEGDVPLAAAVLDTVSRGCAAVIGDLLSVPTSALAAGARALGVPIVSPTATDESIGRIGPAVFQVGPSALERGRRLARALVTTRGRHVVILTSSAAARSPFVDGFAAEAESLDAVIVRRETYAPGSTDFRLASRMVRTFGADLLFWDGESREAEALLRQLGADAVAVRVCGGTALSPEQVHAGSRALLEGVAWVADDWQVPAEAQAQLESLARARGEKPGPLYARGWLAGRRIADAVAAGARTSGELAARLRHGDGALRAGGFLDCGADGATLPVWTVTRGRTTELPVR